MLRKSLRVEHVCEITNLSSLFQAGRCATAAPGGWSEQPGGAQKGSHTRQVPHLILPQVPTGGNSAAHAARGREGVGLAVTAAGINQKQIKPLR